MPFNLKKNKEKIAQGVNINDQSDLESYLQMLITQLDSTNTLPTEDALSRLTDMSNLALLGVDSFTDLKNMILQQQELTEQKQDMQNQMVSPPQEPGTPVLLTPTAKGNNKMIKPFNLKKAQMGDVPVAMPGMSDTLNDTPEMMGDPLQMQQEITPSKKFNTHSDLNNELLKLSSSKNAFQIAWREIQGENPQEPDSAQAALKNYFSGMNQKSAEQLLDEAGVIYDLVYGKDNASTDIPADYKQVGGFVDEVAGIIKKEAENTVNKTIKKSYNLKKTAQHKTLDNALLWGPSQSRKVDPFLHQPVSDWHIVERNKGFGLVVDDIWNIDYETIWRENVMDKYSRPYRNKEGEWVGGYLNKRFEIDRNIPVTSNYQLKPGQKRKPVLPEYGNTESRLQAARAKGDIEGANDTSKPFNWKEASKKKS